jgi:hypothetical protein
MLKEAKHYDNTRTDVGKRNLIESGNVGIRIREGEVAVGFVRCIQMFLIGFNLKNSKISAK